MAHVVMSIYRPPLVLHSIPGAKQSVTQVLLHQIRHSRVGESVYMYNYLRFAIQGLVNPLSN
eukprot:8621499-Pyramimonas_sp.AAC.1